MSKLFFALALMFFSGGARANTTGFVGNGGEGVEIENHVFVRDLAGFGLHQDPYIGSETDPYLAKSAVNLAIPVPEGVLYRKLTDINAAVPGLGDYILATMKFYTWSLEDFELTPIPDPADPVRLPPNAKVVQIANRLGAAIRIHAASWSRLDDENKVALLIHEAVYSLVKIQRDGAGFAQSAQKAREVTAALFSRGFYANDVMTNYHRIGEVLSLPENLWPLAAIRKPAVWSFTVSRFSQTGPTSDLVKVIRKFDYILKPSLKMADVISQIKTICRDVLTLKARDPRSSFTIVHRYVPKSVNVVASQYPVDVSPAYWQTSIGVEDGPGPLTELSYDFEDIQGCENNLGFHLRSVAKDLW